MRYPSTIRVHPRGRQRAIPFPFRAKLMRENEMSTKDTNDSLITSVVASFASRPDVTPDDIVDLVRKLRSEVGLEQTAAGEAEAAPAAPAATDGPGAASAATATPALPLSQAVTRDKVFCLCCGRGFKMLKRHLGSEHGLTELQYRRMFDLPEDMPLVAPSYSERKADYAKQAGFGKHDRHATAEDDSSRSKRGERVSS